VLTDAAGLVLNRTRPALADLTPDTAVTTADHIAALKDAEAHLVTTALRLHAARVAVDSRAAPTGPGLRGPTQRAGAQVLALAGAVNDLNGLRAIGTAAARPQKEGSNESEIAMADEQSLAAGLPPMPARMSADEVNTMLDHLRAQRAQIRATRDQLKLLDKQLDLLENALSSVSEWIRTFAGMEDIVTPPNSVCAGHRRSTARGAQSRDTRIKPDLGTTL
jgi:hypothetical protein